MFLKNHSYVSEKSYVCFWKNIPLFLRKHTCVFVMKAQSRPLCCLRRSLLLLSFTLVAALTVAQVPDERRNRHGGVYFAYPFDSTYTETPPPAGYKPVYVSHFGRHGSRWLPSDERYEWVLAQFADTTRLTPLGLDVRERLQAVWADARGHGGQLTPVGARQQRQIARRMAGRLAGLLSGGRMVEARSSVVGRCVQSMEAFVDEWRQQEVDVQMDVRTDSADMRWIAYTSPEVEELERTTVVPLSISPEPFIARLFRHPASVERPADLLIELHTIASDMQDVDIGVCLDDIFTDEESAAVYRRNNERMWVCNGLTERNAHAAARSAVSLWEDIRDHADAALAAGADEPLLPSLQAPAARLRFGHDTSLYRLLTLLRLGEGTLLSATEPDEMDRVVPMAANLQMIFYRDAEGDVLVKFLLHEQEVLLPLDSPLAPYYSWEEVKGMGNEE